MRNVIKYFLGCVFLIGCTKNQKLTGVNMVNFPDQPQTSLPALFANDKEELFLSWVKKVDDSTSFLKYSKLVNGAWKLPKGIVKGTNWFVNWADYPTIATNKGALLSHFLKKSAKDTYAYDIKLNISKNGTDWDTGLTLHTDGTKTEHGFVSILPYKDHFFLAWLDGRNMEKKEEVLVEGHSGHEGGMTLRCAIVSAEGKVLDEQLLDAKTCSCCQTTAAMTKNGPIVLYRDRTVHEIRDIAITRYVNGKWITPQPIYNDGWMINGCPVNGPRVAAIGNDVAVAWFTAVNDVPTVKVIFSEDGGANFLPPISISKEVPLGRVAIELIDTDHAIVSWIESEGERSYLKAMKVHKLGVKGTPMVVTEMESSRKSGFPQMKKSGDRIYFAWTAIKEGQSSIQTANVAITAF
ncbi:hypothetical protein [Tenacibaculum maritimum]|uniref:hypothetical protein n=1 Tax=Tenacibaculum maritimum TaxID=107401 RepID=UPI0038761CBE